MPKQDNGKFKFEKERTFRIDHVSTDDGERYQGVFSCRRLTVGQISMAASLRATLNGGMHHDPDGGGVDAGTDVMNEMIAHCEVAIITSPPWWNARDVYDPDLLRAVYEECLKFATFREWQRQQDGDAHQQAGAAAGQGAPGSGPEHPETIGGGDAAPVVDLEVPPPPD